MDFLKSIVFGIVEGITEWLPISSTGHMILLQEIMPMNVSEEFWNLYLVVIQFGAILAVILLFWNKIWPFRMRTTQNGTRHVSFRRSVLRTWILIIIACIPAGIVGVIADDWIDAHLYNWYVVAIMLILVGILFIVVENYNMGLTPTTTKMSSITPLQALIIGLFQMVAAIFPGTSRSGATIIGGIIIGISRPAAAEFTFVLAIPVMAGASVLKFVKYNGSLTGSEWGILLIGMATAFLVSLFIIRFLMNYVRKHDFKVFGWYRIILGIIVLAFFGIRAVLAA
jgi:undecaprenyl-diphosphatase